MKVVDPGFATFAELVRESVVGVGEKFRKPDDDWAAMFMTEDVDDRVSIFAVGALTDDTRTLGEAVLPVIVRNAEAKRAALIVSSWMLVAKREGETLSEEQQRASLRREVHLHPDRKEVLVVTIAGAVAVEVWVVPIVRDPKKPPTLGEWQNIAAEGTLSGQMIEPWVAALRPSG